MNKKVRAPQYYWKAICDPTIRQSIVYVGENPVGSTSTVKVPGCLGRSQTVKLGIMNCMSLQAAKTQHSDLKLPDFDPISCSTNVRGSFLDAYITFK